MLLVNSFALSPLRVAPSTAFVCEGWDRILKAYGTPNDMIVRSVRDETRRQDREGSADLRRRTGLPGTGVTLRTVLASLAAGDSVEEILADFPALQPEHVQAAIAFAAASAARRPARTSHSTLLMKIKFDENLPVSLAVILSNLQHDVHTVAEENLSGSSDREVWEAAQRDKRFLITQDLDFSDLRRFLPGTHCGILLVRLRSPDRQSLIGRVQEVFQKEDVSRWTGCFVVATERNSSRAAPGLNVRSDKSGARKKARPKPCPMRGKQIPTRFQPASE